MKPYTDKAVCPKCQSSLGARKDGDGRYTLTYCSPVKEMSTTETVEGHKLVTIYHAPWVPIPEHLRCTCTSCGYERLMECADAGSKEVEPPNNTIQNREVVCPACHDILLVVSDHQHLVHLETYSNCKPKEDEPPEPTTTDFISCPYCAQEFEVK